MEARCVWRFVISVILIAQYQMLFDLKISIRMKAGAMTIMVLILLKKKAASSIDDWKNKNVQHVICMFPWQMCLWLWTVWKWNYGPICQPIKKWDAKNSNVLNWYWTVGQLILNQILDSNYFKSLFKKRFISITTKKYVQEFAWSGANTTNLSEARFSK